MGERFQPCGVVVDGPTPLGVVVVPFDSSCTAFYGLNGVGKTRLLRAVEALARGVPHGDGYVYGRVLDDPDSGGDERLDVFEEALVKESASMESWVGYNELHYLEHGMSMRGEGPFLPDAPAVLPFLDRVAAFLSLRYVRYLTRRDPEPGDDWDLLDQIAHAGWLILRPQVAGRWSLEVGALIGSDGLVGREVSRLRSAWAEFRSLLREQDVELGSSAASELWRDFPARLEPYDSPFTAPGVFGRPLDLDHLGWMDERTELLDNPQLVVPVCRDDWAEAHREMVIEVDLFDAISDADLTAEALRERTRSLFVMPSGLPWSDRAVVEVNEHGAIPARSVELECEELSGAANGILQQLDPTSPDLRCVVAPVADWFLGEAVRWSFIEAGGVAVDVAEASFARRRWSTFAAQLAMRAAGDEPLIICLDEPEAGLHARAERNLLGALGPLARERGAVVLAATHSRDFLNQPDVVLTHVFRDHRNLVATSTMGPPQRQRLDILGLSPADMLQLYRVIMVVEGLHDEVVFRRLLGDELDRIGVLVVPLHGARNLASAADARLFADFTDVPVVAVLDNARVERIDAYWSGLALTASDDRAAHDALSAEHFGTGSSKQAEEGFVTQLGRRLHELGRLGRFSVFGLTERDIVMYLPVDALVPGATSWGDLVDEHEAGLADGRGNWPKDFKKWLEQKNRADFSESSLAAACERMDHLPTDFTELLARCEQVIR